MIYYFFLLFYSKFPKSITVLFVPYIDSLKITFSPCTLRDAETICELINACTKFIAPDTVNESNSGSVERNVVVPLTIKSPSIITEPVALNEPVNKCVSSNVSPN